MKHLNLDYLRSLGRLAHFAAIPLALMGAFLLRFEFDIPDDERYHLYGGLLVAFLCKSLVFGIARLDRVVWRFVSIPDLKWLAGSNVVGSLLTMGVLLAVYGKTFPRSIYILDFLFCFGLQCALRISGRLMTERRLSRRRSRPLRPVIIYGAGEAGRTLAREILKNPHLGYDLLGFIDDNPNRRHARLENLPVLGAGRQTPEIVDRLRKRGRKVAEIVIAMPSASGREMKEVLAHCRAAGVQTKTIPGLGELLTGKILSAQIRDVSVTDLLGREPVHIEEEKIMESLAGKVVLVTGAAGSIGSELCRQIAEHNPAGLIAFDQAESDLFRIDGELRTKFPHLKIDAVLGDVRDPECVDDTIRGFGVQSIFHAAAYKHVPMMEAYPLEAIRNNVFGTHNLVQAAWKYHVSSFLMISSDKAVNPSSIMGATKRLDELILSSMPNNGTRFVSVRFGNVLGSNGSVIPIFQKQIEAGGPVTVTHPDMCRYFMTIREAVQLVLLASTMGKGSEIFVLDMGQPVKIVDLANQMIRLAGKTPGEDIQLRFTGPRKGEKMFEEINTNFESCLPTSHKKIRVFQSARAPRGEVLEWLGGLQRLMEQRDNAGVVSYLTRIIPEFNCDAHWKESAAPKVLAATSAN